MLQNFHVASAKKNQNHNYYKIWKWFILVCVSIASINMMNTMTKRDLGRGA